MKIDITNLAFISFIAIVLIFLLYRFNKWLFKKEGILRLLYVFLKRADEETVVKNNNNNANHKSRV